MNVPKYPEDFFSFAEGFDINNETINLWIAESIDNLEKNPNMPFSDIRSGNTSVRVDRGDGEHTKYEISVAKSYGTAEIRFK